MVNQYGGIKTRYIYININDFKLFLKDKELIYCISQSNNVTSRKIINKENIKNFSLINKCIEDYSYVKDFVRTYAYRFEPYEFPTREAYAKEVSKWEKKAVELLSDEAKLAYEIES